MVRKKPAGWPRYMSVKRVKAGEAYYWSAPTWAKAAGCKIDAEALGRDYGAAKRRCDEVLNPAFDAWRTQGEATAPIMAAEAGTFDWMVAKYKASPRFNEASAEHRKATDEYLRKVADYRLSNGARFGSANVKGISPGAADKVVAKLGVNKDGKPIKRTATGIATACRTAWNAAHRIDSERVPKDNPFASMGLKYRPKRVRPVTHDELLRFVNAADEAGEPSIGTAAMISYYWLLRQKNVLRSFSWSHYRPKSNPSIVQAWHSKNDAEIELPLYQEDGTPLWPEIMERLDASPRLGTLIVTRTTIDRRHKTHLPWAPDNFRHRVAEIRNAAGLPADWKFMGLRHGGMTAAANAGLTDAQIRALSGHRSANITLRYAQETNQQRVDGAEKMRDARTKKENLSE